MGVRILYDLWVVRNNYEARAVLLPELAEQLRQVDAERWELLLMLAAALKLGKVT